MRATGRLSILLVFVSALAFASVPGSVVGSDRSQIPAGYQVKAQTEDCLLAWRDGVEAGKGFPARAAELCDRRVTELSRELRDEDGPERPIVLLFEGPGQQPDGSWKAPNVDYRRIVHLYRFSSEEASYLDALAHELVHVFRFAATRQGRFDGFLEEGLAEYITDRLTDERNGFPYWGYDPLVVSGQWLGTDAEIPLATIRDRHRSLNLRCKLQTYTQRGSFFRYLGRTHGHAAMLRLATFEPPGAADGYRDAFGEDLDTLIAAWREDLQQRYQAKSDSGELARAYRNRSPAAGIPICREGQDF